MRGFPWVKDGGQSNYQRFVNDAILLCTLPTDCRQFLWGKYSHALRPLLETHHPHRGVYYFVQALADAVSRCLLIFYPSVANIIAILPVC